MAKLENLKPFKKGNDPRRNMSGRPQGTLNLTNLLRAKLAELADGEDKKTNADILVDVTFRKATKEGDTTLIKYCYDRLDGMPTQKQEVKDVTNMDDILDKLEGKNIDKEVIEDLKNYYDL